MQNVTSAAELELGAFYEVEAKWFSTAHSWPISGQPVTLQYKKVLGGEVCFGDGERRVSLTEAFDRCAVRGPVPMPAHLHSRWLVRSETD